VFEVGTPAPAHKKPTDNPLREDGPRHIAYLARAKMLFVKNIRYTAYASDVGEGLRPVLPSWAVKSAYGFAGLYMVGDVVYETAEVRSRGAPDYVVARTAAHATTFQLIASLIIPSAIIHTAVSKSGKLFKKLGMFTKWGPSVVGISLIPLMPLIDHPVEGVIDAAFDKYLPLPKEWQHNPDTGDGGVHQHDKYDAEQDPAKKGNSGEAPPAAAAAALPAGGEAAKKAN